MKRLLELEGIQTSTPKDTIKHAYQVYWLKDERAWLDILTDRNQTAHTYDQDLATEIYEHIQAYYPEMRKTYDFLVKHFSDGGDE